MRPNDVNAIFGAFNLSDHFEDGRIVLTPIVIKVHDDWNPSARRYDADIALLTFEDEVPVLKNIQPICLWDDESLPSQTEGYVSGWGKTQGRNKNHAEIPAKLKMPIHSNEQCFLNTSKLAELSSNRTFCAGNGDGRGVCNGDSGAALFIEVNSNFSSQLQSPWDCFVRHHKSTRLWRHKICNIYWRTRVQNLDWPDCKRSSRIHSPDK